MDKKYRVTWETLKSLAAKKFVGFHSCDLGNAVEVFLIEDGVPSFWCHLLKPDEVGYDADLWSDWLTLEPKANGPTKPRDSDGRDRMQPVSIAKSQWHYWHSIGDSASALRAGEQFKVSRTLSGDTTLEWRYRDPVWMAGGKLLYSGAALGDHISFCVFAPATSVTASGNNTGNCNVSSGVIVPAAGNGAYIVDLDDCHPVPTPAQDGYWDYALPADNKLAGTTTASATPGEAKYHLMTSRVDLTHFVAKELLLGSGSSDYSPENINASLCLPEWRFECKVHNEDGLHTVVAAWRVLVSRYWTTV